MALTIFPLLILAWIACVVCERGSTVVGLPAVMYANQIPQHATLRVESIKFKFEDEKRTKVIVSMDVYRKVKEESETHDKGSELHYHCHFACELPKREPAKIGTSIHHKSCESWLGEVDFAWKESPRNRLISWMSRIRRGRPSHEITIEFHPREIAPEYGSKPSFYVNVLDFKEVDKGLGWEFKRGHGKGKAFEIREVSLRDRYKTATTAKKHAGLETVVEKRKERS